MYERVYGSEYNNKLSTTEIAKIVRKKIAAAKKSGELDKGFKISVRSAYFSGGSAIRLSITAVPDGVEVFNPEYYLIVARNESFRNYGQKVNRYSDEVERVRKMVHGFAQDYNHDGSETMVDYFDVNFYCNGCDVSWSKFSEAEKDLEAKVAAELSQ